MSSEALPSLFSELVSSKCDGDRERTKARFEDQCQLLDTKLAQLLKTKGQDMSDIVKFTSQAIEMVSNSKAKCRLLRVRLETCKETLQCKRDDIRRLWLESLNHKQTYLLLAEIEAVRKIPEEINDHILAKRYEMATKVVVSSIELVEGRLADIEGLKELRLELHRLLDKMYAIFLEELIQELYMSTFHSVYHGDDDCSSKEVTYEKIFNYQPLKDSSKSINFNVSYVTVLLECIVRLGKISETMEILKEECDGELDKIIAKLSKLMHDLVQESTGTTMLNLPESQGQRYLFDLLETILGHFRQILLNNKKFFHILEGIMTSDKKEDSWIEPVDLYSNMQTSLEHFVSSYLEIPTESALSKQCTSSLSELKCGSDLSAYFEFKSYPDEKCQILFKFQDSSQGMVGTKKRANYEHFHGKSEVNNTAIKWNSSKLLLVCKPCLKNITVMFDPIKIFVNEIENALRIGNEMHCPLHMFIHDCANSYLDQINTEVNIILKDASQNLESWNVSIVPDDSSDKFKGSEKQILSSTLILKEKLAELCNLLWKLPAYSNHFLHLIYYIVYYYKDLVHKGFKNMFAEELKPKQENVSGDFKEPEKKDIVEEKHILSVAWAKDEDIGRLLKSFSNWKLLEMTGSGESNDSPEDIRMRNKHESELLIRNLHSGEHSTWEIIENTTILFNIAVLQESLQWFSAQLQSLSKDFEPLMGDAEVSSKFSFNAVSGLNKLVEEYEHFSDVCLLALHLEVRAHCFHHLMNYETVDVDVCAKNLAEDLNKIEEALVPALTPKELKYIFEGLGELVASILIHNISKCSQVMSKEFGKRVHRAVFVIHCCLANITMTREVSFERVRHFVRSLYLSHDEVVNEAMEKGPRFSEHEYKAMLKIILRGKENEAKILEDSMRKIRKIQNGSAGSIA